MNPPRLKKSSPYFPLPLLPTGMHWHVKWRNLKVELSPDYLEAGYLSGSSSSHWATFAADKLLKNGRYFMEVEILNPGKTKSRDHHRERLAVGLLGCKGRNPNDMEWQNRKTPIGEWEGESWAYFPVGGMLKSHSIRGEGIPYGQNLTLQAEDRVGILLDLPEGKLTYFCNGNELGMAFDDLQDKTFLLAVSIRDKIKVRLRFPPPPYSNRNIKLIQMMSHS